jgi:hypothetical protein
MCLPAAVLIPAIVGIAQAGLSAVQSIGAYSAEKQAAKESERAYQEQRQLNAQAADRGYQQAQAKLKGSYDQASQKAEELLVQRLQTQGTTIAAGRAGQSIGGLLTDAQRTEGRDLATLGMNLATDQGDYSWTVNDIYASHKSANITAAGQRKAMPSKGGLILGLGSAALSGISAAVPLIAPGAGAAGKGASSAYDYKPSAGFNFPSGTGFNYSGGTAPPSLPGNPYTYKR